MGEFDPIREQVLSLVEAIMTAFEAALSLSGSSMETIEGVKKAKMGIMAMVEEVASVDATERNPDVVERAVENFMEKHRSSIPMADKWAQEFIGYLCVMFNIPR